MEIHIACENAAPELLRVGKLAAVRSLIVADITVLAAGLAVKRHAEWTSAGCKHEDELSFNEGIAYLAAIGAEVAALKAMNLGPGVRIVIDWV